MIPSKWFNRSYHSFSNSYLNLIVRSTIVVPAGGDLQAALDMAQPGDMIVLKAGASFIGNLSFCKEDWIMVDNYQHLDLAGLPADRVPVTPAKVAKMTELNRRYKLRARFSAFRNEVSDLAGLVIRLALDLGLVAVVLVFVLAGTWLKGSFTKRYLELEHNPRCAETKGRVATSGMKSPKKVKSKQKLRK